MEKKMNGNGARGLGSMPGMGQGGMVPGGGQPPQQNPMDAQIRQLAMSDPSQARVVVEQVFRQQGIDPAMPLVRTLMQYVSTGGMDMSAALSQLMQ